LALLTGARLTPFDAQLAKDIAEGKRKKKKKKLTFGGKGIFDN